jgi:Predicted periplasmic solute-binding protein
MPLQVDCAILYDNNGKFDKEIDSPYNTYKYGGLPAGPICNPGMESIEAAIEPAETRYWYYLSAPDGTTIFSKNYDEHLANVAKYLKK